MPETLRLPPGWLRQALPLVLGVGGTILGQILLARALQLEVYGEYSLILAWVNSAAALAVAGFQFGAMRVLPRLRLAREGAATRFAAFEVARSVGALSVAATGLLGLIVVLNPFNVAPVTFHQFLPALLLVPLLALSQVRVAICTALGRLWLGQLPDNVVRPLLIGGFAVAFSTMASGAGTLLLLTVVVYGTVTIVGGALLWRALPPSVTGQFDAAAIRSDLRQTAIYMGGSNMAISLMKSADIMIVGALLPPAQLAIYVVATRMSDLVNVVYLLIDPILVPRLAGLLHAGDPRSLRTALRQYCYGSSAWSIACLTASALLGGSLLGLFGTQYEGNQDVLVGLVLVQTLNALTGPGGQLLALAGLERINFSTTALTSAAHLGVTAALTSHFGMPGAIAALFTYQLVRGLIQAGYVRRRLGLRIMLWDVSTASP